MPPGEQRVPRVTSIDDIRERLTEIRPPGLAQDILALGMVRAIDIDDGAVTLQIEPPATLAAPLLSATVADIRRAVGALQGVRAVHVHTVAPRTQGGAPAEAFTEVGPLPGIRDIIAVA